MCLSKEVVQQIFHTQIAFEICCLEKSCCDPSNNKKKYLTSTCVTFIEVGNLVYRYCGLLYHCIANRVDRDPMIAYRVWIRRVQEGHVKRNAESQKPAITNS